MTQTVPERMLLNPVRSLSFMSEEAKARKQMQTGPTGHYVAANVRRLRERRALSTYQLSGALKTAGHPIAPSSITNIEAGRRRVDVDDLTALAGVFGVSPSALLLPLTDDPTDSVTITGCGTVPAFDAWRWAHGERPLKLTAGREQTEMLEHQLYGLPQWLRPMGRDIAMTHARLREAGFPIDEWLRTQGLIEQEGGNDGPRVD